MSDVHDAPAVDQPSDGPLQWLGAAELAAVVRRFAALLDLRRTLLDELNVFPVPDGDTGTNMASTVHAVCASLDANSLDDTGGDDAIAAMERTCHAIAHGSLMGARGNSGVILSQILRGVAHTVGATSRADAQTVAQALVAGAAGAYAAVGRPVEGTILTVAREAAEAATAASTSGEGLSMVVRRARDAAADAVARSPRLLPVLADAGVVDAGGAGLALLFDAALEVIDRHPTEGTDIAAVDHGDLQTRWGLDPARRWVHALDQQLADQQLASEHSGQYEVMFLLGAEAVDAERLAAFGRAWDAIGDSVVIVGGSNPDGTGLWNCHIHTDDIGAAIEASLDVGRPTRIRVTDLSAQMAGSQACRHVGDELPVTVATADVATAVVAVANGSGLIDIMRDQGATQVVEGGQGANPSTAQLAAAVTACRADSVVLLPNNPNIVAVANQVGSVVGDGARRVVVVPTRSVVAGLAALSVCNPNATARDNAVAMQAAADAVVAAEVTRAMRASTCDAGPIAAGDWLGMTDGVVGVVGSDAAAVVTELVGRLVGDDHELVTLVVGADADEQVTAALVGILADVHPQLDVEVHHGGQPLYPYLIGIE